MTRRGKRQSEDGAAAVELALVFPVLALLLFGIISYGYMFSVRQAVSQAAAEGARAGAVLPPGSPIVAAAEAAVNQSLTPYDVNCSDGDGTNCKYVVTTGDCAGETIADCVEVVVTVKYDQVDPFNIPLIPMPGSFSFTSTAEIN